jgi:Tfp pilus assembly protein PilE
MKIRNLGKKGDGFLESEVVKIIIAVICISFLIYFAFLIYQASREKNEGRQAKATLEEIGLRAEKMNVGDQANYLYLAPKNYYFSRSYDEKKIAQCATKYCICLCNEDDCSDFNICRKTDKLFSIGELEGKKINATITYLIKNTPEFYTLELSNVQ